MQSHPTPEDIDLYRATLHELIELGTNIARDIAAQASRDTKALVTTPDAPRPDHTIAFDRVARTVRRCILLAQHLHTNAKRSERTRARTEIIRTVDDAITAARTQDKSTLRTELRERLDAPDLVEAMDDDLATRPIPEIIRELRRDLGLANVPGCDPWPRRTPHDIRALLHDATLPSARRPPVKPSQAPGAGTPAPPPHAPAAPPQPPPGPRSSGSPATPG